MQGLCQAKKPDAGKKKAKMSANICKFARMEVKKDGAFVNLAEKNEQNKLCVILLLTSGKVCAIIMLSICGLGDFPPKIAFIRGETKNHFIIFAEKEVRYANL